MKSESVSQSVVSNSVRPHRRQPTRLPRPWDSPGKNTGAGCHFLLQCMKGKSESEVVQSCPTLRDPMVCSLPGSSVHGIFQARILEWGAIVFSKIPYICLSILYWCFSFWLTSLCRSTASGPNPSSPALLPTLKIKLYWNTVILGHLYTVYMAPHSSTLAWKIPGTEEPGRLQTMGSRRVGHD